MILHISIPAKQPAKVAQVLAELCQGVVKPFKPLKNAFMVYANDEHSSGFEVYPDTITFAPGDKENEPSRFVSNQMSPNSFTTHAAIITYLARDELKTIADREDWRLIYTRRQNSFNLYEFWLENRFLLEIIVQEDLCEAKKALRCL